MRNRRWIIITFSLLVIFGLYFLGPKPDHPIYATAFPVVPDSSGALESYLQRHESLHRVKPDNEARIVWHHTGKKRSEYAVVYLHGFSASQEEGDPIHERFAREFGCNLFLSRLSDHGIDTTDALYYFTPDRAWESAKDALAIGGKIGDKVIIMSTSTGGTLALMLAAYYPEKVHALINMSPNIAINDPAAFVLNNPWGLQIARMVMGGKYRETGTNELESKYWNATYRLESLVALQELLETSMKDDLFAKIRQPSLTLYYYKNEIEQDPQVKVSAMLEMHRLLGTSDSLKVEKAIPGAGAHVIGSSMTSHDLEAVYSEVEQFAIKQLRMVKQANLAAQLKGN